MITKKRTKTTSFDPRLRAGEEAEFEMAFLLERRFSNEPNIHVINDLRIEHKNNAFQIDHLVVTPWGLFVIESKSAHSTIKIKVWDNKRQHWSREFNGTFEGMDSPVRQAEEQARLLKIFLRENHEKMLGKMAGFFQKGFRYCPIIEMVAISKNGKIEVENSSLPEKVFKADEIAPEIANRINELRKKANLLNISLDSGWEMTADESARAAKFLTDSHCPSKQRNPSTTTSIPSAVPRVGAKCPSCGLRKLVRKSMTRSDGTETDYLACEGYPKECSQIFALVTQPVVIAKTPIPDDHRNNGIENKTALKRPTVSRKTLKECLYCFMCKETITKKVAKYCFDQPSIFGGRAYCVSCQNNFKKH